MLLSDGKEVGGALLALWRCCRIYGMEKIAGNGCAHTSILSNSTIRRVLKLIIRCQISATAASGGTNIRFNFPLPKPFYAIISLLQTSL